MLTKLFSSSLAYSLLDSSVASPRVRSTKGEPKAQLLTRNLFLLTFRSSFPRSLSLSLSLSRTLPHLLPTPHRAATWNLINFGKPRLMMFPHIVKSCCGRLTLNCMLHFSLSRVNPLLQLANCQRWRVDELSGHDG